MAVGVKCSLESGVYCIIKIGRGQFSLEVPVCVASLVSPQAAALASLLALAADEAVVGLMNLGKEEDEKEEETREEEVLRQREKGGGTRKPSRRL